MTESGKAFATMLMAAQSYEFGGDRQESERTFKTWEVEQVVISARMRASFPNTKLASDWDALAHATDLLYEISAQGDPNEMRIWDLREYVGSAVWT